MSKQCLIIIFSLALLLRLFFIPNPGFEADVAFWKGWGLAAADKGGLWAILNTNNNYPTPFVYTLGLMVVLYRLLGGDPHNVEEYWTNTNLRFLFVSKLPSILADFGIALIILFIGRTFTHLFESKSTNIESKYKKQQKQLSLNPSILFPLLAAFYLLNPVSIMDGAWWGQVDSLGVVYFLLVVLALLYKRTFVAGMVFMFAMMTKLQNMIYGPLLFVFVWRIFGFQGMMKTLAGAMLAFLGLNIEFLLSKNMTVVIGSLVNNYDYFPYMSLHAYNPWWILSGGNGMGMSDKFMTIGILNAKTVGTILFASCYLIAVVSIVRPVLQRILFSRKKQKPFAVDSSTTTQYPFSSDMPAVIFEFFLGLCLINLGFFLFLTQSHERYAFPFFAFCLFLVPFLSAKRQIVFLMFYTFFSLIYFLNLHTAFAFNYPNNVFQWLRFLATPFHTNVISYIQISCFVFFMIFFFKQYSKIAIGSGILLCVGLLTLGNLSYIRGNPIYLSSLTPYRSFQEYGARQKNMPVAAGSNPKTWAFLSTQYAFFRKGIGTHANSEITYDIGRKFSQLRTDYGIDTIAGAQASAIFEIWGDGRQLFASQKMGRFDMPKHTVVDITGVKELTLVTRDAGDKNFDDHTNWLNTKLYR
ncbi:MAG: NPCBM/NEW2 domain-containing protein [Patescibacteria group bacterium]|nr:NPCBM/NEW2 domain-containing protein [Patescibacteria group bacterium]